MAKKVRVSKKKKKKKKKMGVVFFGGISACCQSELVWGRMKGEENWRKEMGKKKTKKQNKRAILINGFRTPTTGDTESTRAN